MSFRHKYPPHSQISEILAGSEDITVLILSGHRFIEYLLEDYIAHAYPQREFLNIAHLSFEQKMSLVLAHIDLPSWCDKDDVDYRIAEEMLGNMNI